MTEYGVTGYLTPDNVPEDSHCRIIRIPNSTQWLSVFMGALLALTYETNWQQWGNLTPAEAADAALDVIWDAYNNNYCSLEVQPPYWSDADNVGLEEAASVPSDWYGVVRDEVWHEQLGDWVITGFLAIAASPLAAIQYITFVPRFRLALRQHDIGSAVKIFLDGTQIFVGDTYSASPSIMNVDVDADAVSPGISPHTIIVEQTSASSLQVVRKQLDPAELYPTNRRYNSGTNIIQTTSDGGVTWVNTPQYDPRHNVSFQFPPIVAGDPRCQAAANMVRFFHNVIDETLTAISEGLELAAVATTILTILDVELGPFAILIDLVLALAELLLSAGATAVSAAFTTTAYDQLMCIFYCAIESDGTVTATDVTTIESLIASQIGGLVETVMDAGLYLVGEVGLTNAGAKGDAPADCSGCDCGLFCYSWPSPSLAASTDSSSAWWGYDVYLSNPGVVFDAAPNYGASPAAVQLLHFEADIYWNGNNPPVGVTLNHLESGGSIDNPSSWHSVQHWDISSAGVTHVSWDGSQGGYGFVLSVAGPNISGGISVGATNIIMSGFGIWDSASVQSPYEC